MRSDALYLQDISDAITAIGRFVADVSREDFMADDLRQSAVLQS